MKSSIIISLFVILVLQNGLAQEYCKDENVDIYIPQGKILNDDAVAVVIGNRNYQNSDIPTVEYAHVDAKTIKKYVIRTLGYKERNILHEENITKARFEAIFGIKDDHQGILSDYIKPSKSDVFIYYSGHGVPDPNSKQGYFVPVDCDPSKIRLNGYSLQTFYNNLAKLYYKSLTVVIDACFSGGTSSGDQLISSASQIFIKVENPITVMNNSIIFTSSQGDQISSWYDEKKHGLFTFFFLNALRGYADRDRNKQITFQEIYEYVSDMTNGVPYYAKRLHGGRKQIPTMSGRGEGRTFAHLSKLPEHNIPRPPPTTATVPMGHLQVNVNGPEARIYLDDEYLGTAKFGEPLNEYNIPTGSVNISVDADGYIKTSKQVDIKKNQWSQAVFELLPMPQKLPSIQPTLIKNKAANKVPVIKLPKRKNMDTKRKKATKN